MTEQQPEAPALREISDRIERELGWAKAGISGACYLMDRENVDSMRAGLVRYIAERWPHAPEPAGETGAQAVPSPPVAAVLDREALGRIVHETRCAENAKRDRPFRLEPWDRRAPSQQELDMKIAEAVAAALRGSYVHAACDAQVERLHARARAAEATLAALRAVMLEGGQDDASVRRRALGIIGSEGENVNG